MDVTMEKAVEVVRAAEAAGINPLVLAKLPGADKLSYAIDGSSVLVTPEGGSAVALEDYAQEHWKEFLPSLDLKPQTLGAAEIDAAKRRDPLYSGGI